MNLDVRKLRDRIGVLWRDEIISQLVDYIRIPAKSPHFDPDWESAGHIEAAVTHMTNWSRGVLDKLPGSSMDIVRLPGRTPVILIDIPGHVDDCVLLYGHLDKQPEMTGWAEGLGPWSPVIRDGRLYGRGGADDGYAIYACLAAILAAVEQGATLARCVILIEASEESGSFELPAYLDHLGGRLGDPSLVICLDSGCGNYDQLWVTTSLRGLASGTLTVAVLKEAVHSGDASGIVPDSFRIARQLLARLERETDGTILLDELHLDVPALRRLQAEQAANALGPELWQRFPWASGEPWTLDGAELVLARTWRPQLAVVGAAGLPDAATAGNAIAPTISLKLSLRTAPTCDAEQASRAIARVMTQQPPQDVCVTFEPQVAMSGWHAPPNPEWLERTLDAASDTFFGQPAAYMGEGGTIPFMAMLGARYPNASFVVTGVLGPKSNAHGPNEFLDLKTAERLTCCTAMLLTAHAAHAAAQQKLTV